MADNQDKLSQKDQKMLDDLEKQLTGSPKQSPKIGVDSKAPTSSSHEDANNEKKVKDNQPERPIVKANTGFLWFVTLLNFIGIAALLAGAYWGWMQWQNQQQQQSEFIAQQESNFAKQQDEFASSLAADQRVKADLQAQTEAEQARLTELDQAIKQNAQQTDNNQRQISELTGRRPADWLLAEANFLLNIAGRKLWLDHDVATAILMLQAADSRLQDMDDASLLGVREKLSSDIVALQQINAVSTTSLALELSGLNSQVTHLPLAFFKKPDMTDTTGEVSSDQGDWKANLMTSINKVLDGFFSVKKITAEVKPFMSEQQQWLVREQLKFALLSAQTALLQEQWPVFTDAIRSAQSLINEHFEVQKQSVVQFSDSLATLLKSDLERNYPEQFSATSALQDIVESRLGNRFTNGNN